VLNNYLMSLKQISLIFFTVFLLSIGQILFKQASGKMDIEGRGIFEAVILNITLLYALVVYGFATILWVFVLRTAPLSYVYPFSAMAFILVPVFAYLFLGEELKWTTLSGALFIMAGVYITQQ
jgi:drug/metabolite transporter (DMT)-like permease